MAKVTRIITMEITNVLDDADTTNVEQYEARLADEIRQQFNADDAHVKVQMFVHDDEE